jgi:ribosomal protein S18 acetylase RimI-like enzyme
MNKLDINTPRKGQIVGEVEGDIRGKISDKEVSHWAIENGYNISDKEDFDIATKMATQRPNYGMGNIVFGKEQRTEERKNVHTHTYEKNGNTLNWNLGIYENGNGGKRYLLYEEKYPEQIDAGAIVDKDGKVAHIRTDNDFRSIGLAQTLLKEIQKDYGKIIPSEPISKKGAKAIYRFEKEQTNGKDIVNSKVKAPVSQFMAKSNRYFEYVPTSEVDVFKEFDREVTIKFDKSELDTLTRQVKKNGITAPLDLEVYRGHALLVEGNHRLAVAKRLGIEYLPLRVTVRNSDFGSINKHRAVKINTRTLSELMAKYPEVGIDDWDSSPAHYGFTKIYPTKAFKNGGLIAPNGQKSNLNPKQYKLVRTPEFKAWFGDWENDPKNASKVVDENGEPLVVYHGTTRVFNEFIAPSYFSSAKPRTTGGKSFLKKWIFFFTPNKKIAENYSTKQVLSVFLNIKGLLVIDAQNNLWKEYTELILKEYKQKTNNGILIKNVEDNFTDNAKIDNVYVVFDDTLNDLKIKLADGSNTTFNPGNPDIRYAKGGLLASNGKKSNLTPEQYKLVRTPEFKAWFGDWENDPKNASKVVDENGEPLVVYHYTSSKFNVFEEKKLSKGFFFTPQKKDTEFDYLGREIKCFLNIKILGELSQMPTEQWSIPFYENQWIEKSKSKKGDGIRFIRELDNKTIYVAYNSEQIKLADGSNTTFNASNPDIRYSEGGLLARNGKKSNLTPEQYKLVRTPAFKAWFGDWEDDPKNASKVVDGNGEPLVVYHGSGTKNIQNFDSKKSGSIQYSDWGNGIYFTPHKSTADYYSNEAIIKNDKLYNELYEIFERTQSNSDLKNFQKRGRELSDNKETIVYPVFLNMRNPLEEVVESMNYTDPFLSRTAIEKKNDGIIILNGRFKFDELLVFDSKQIKLADASNTTFNPVNPDIRYAQGGEIIFKRNKTKLNEANYGRPNKGYNEIPLIHETTKDNAKSILKGGFKVGNNHNITKGVYTIPMDWKNKKFDEKKEELIITLKEGSNIFWTNSERPTDYYIGDGNKFYQNLYKKINNGFITPNDDYFNKEVNKEFNERMEKWLKENKYVGVQQGGEIVITDLNAISSLKILNRSNPDIRYAQGGMTYRQYVDTQFNEDEDRYLPTGYLDSFIIKTNRKKEYPILYQTKNGLEYRLRNEKSSVIGVFDSDKLIADADNKAIQVSPLYQRMGIGLELVTILKERNPSHRFGSMTPEGFILMGKYYDKKIATNKNISYAQGGPTDFGKVISASSRFKPSETIIFEPALIGNNGNKLVSYSWAYEFTMVPNYEGELVTKRISDWTQAETSAETGRGIVHKYGIDMADGTHKTVSSETVPIVLGFIDDSQKKTFGNIATASKTLAKQEMKLAIMEAQKKEYDILYQKYEKSPKPTIEIAEIDDLSPITKHVIERMKSNDEELHFIHFKMDDIVYRQDFSPNYSYKPGQSHYTKTTTPNNDTINQLQMQWISSKVKEDGGINPSDIYDMRNRVARQKKKISQLLKQQDNIVKVEQKPDTVIVNADSPILNNSEMDSTIKYVSDKTGIEFTKSRDTNSWYGSNAIFSKIRISDHPSKFVEKQYNLGFKAIDLNLNYYAKEAMVHLLNGTDPFANLKPGDKIQHKSDIVGEVEYVSHSQEKENITVKTKDGRNVTYFADVFLSPKNAHFIQDAKKYDNGGKLDAVELFAEKVKELLKKRGINLDYNTSKTDYGVSSYFHIYENNNIEFPPVTFRISDHSVTNRGRMANEVHIVLNSNRSYDPINEANNMERLIYPQRYLFQENKDGGYFKDAKRGDYKRIYEKGGEAKITTYFNSHGFSMPWDELVEIEAERGNTANEDFQEWSKKYGIKPNDNVIWVAKNKNIAVWYASPAGDFDKIKGMSDSELNDYMQSEGIELYEYSLEDGYIIPESDDGDDGVIMVLQKKYANGGTLENALEEVSLSQKSKIQKGEYSVFAKFTSKDYWNRSEVANKVFAKWDELKEKVIGEYGEKYGSDPLRFSTPASILGDSDDKIIFDEKGNPVAVVVLRADDDTQGSLTFTDYDDYVKELKQRYGRFIVLDMIFSLKKNGGKEALSQLKDIADKYNISIVLKATGIENPYSKKIITPVKKLNQFYRDNGFLPVDFKNLLDKNVFVYSPRYERGGYTEKPKGALEKELDKNIKELQAKDEHLRKQYYNLKLELGKKAVKASQVDLFGTQKAGKLFDDTVSLNEAENVARKILKEAEAEIEKNRVELNRLQVNRDAIIKADKSQMSMFSKGGNTEQHNGDCYKVTGVLAINNSDQIGDYKFIGTPYIIHAEVTGQGSINGIKYGHAWIEDDVYAYDYSNGFKLMAPKVLYHKWGNVKTQPGKFYKYTFREAKEKMYDLEHYGPWDLETESGF